MLDVDKIKIMTKIAFFEEKEEVEYTPVLKTNRKDYVAEKVLGEFFLSTFIYLILSVLVIAALFLTVFDNISKAEIILIMVLDIIGYVIFLFYRMGRRRKLAKKEYNDRNKKYKALRGLYEELDGYYKKTGIKA
jgi:SNF family Na+-dependent transporter